jgi:hypothetical protein
MRADRSAFMPGVTKYWRCPVLQTNLHRSNKSLNPFLNVGQSTLSFRIRCHCRFRFRCRYRSVGQ